MNNILWSSSDEDKSKTHMFNLKNRENRVFSSGNRFFSILGAESTKKEVIWGSSLGEKRGQNRGPKRDVKRGGNILMSGGMREALGEEKGGIRDPLNLKNALRRRC